MDPVTSTTDPVNLVLTIPQGSIIATSLTIEGLARHLSPGSGKYFHGRAIYVDLAISGDKPDFRYLDEGGWRDTQGDTEKALAGVISGKRTKTALSNMGYGCTPLDAYRTVHLVKTGGQVLDMEPSIELARFAPAECPEGLTPADVAKLCGQPEPMHRDPRLYLVFAPIELLVLSNLTPIEYAWYAARRPGKIFRSMAFTELKADQPQLAAYGRFEAGRKEIAEKPTKKTKTAALQDLLNHVPFEHWIGYHREADGGLYVADRSRVLLSRFPENIPYAWERAD